MARNGTPTHGEGTAWLLEDDARQDYICSWYFGPYDAYLGEQVRLPTSAAALTWGRDRTTRVRIRTAAARTYWAGSAPRPEGFTHTWPEVTMDAEPQAPVTC
jgi:hypothetical protein